MARNPGRSRPDPAGFRVAHDPDDAGRYPAWISDALEE